ncbi:MAG: molybdopterin-dependent oxidoreductase [Thermoproteota archaeon]
MYALTRREFLKVLAAVSAAAGVAGSMPVAAEKILKTRTLRKLTPEEKLELERRVRKSEVEVRYTACVMCAAECSLEVWVKDGKVVRIYGNKHVHYNLGAGGSACAKGVSSLNLVYSPYRLKYPLKRVGERGEGKFIRISWEQAIDEIAKKLVEIKKKYGPESVVVDAGDVPDNRDPYWRFGFAFGTPNCLEHGCICDTPRRHGPKLIVGGKRWEPDIMRPVPVRGEDGKLHWYNKHDIKLIIYVGWNPFTATRISWETMGTIRAKLENNAKIVVVDPALSNTAAKADEWIPIRPGTEPDLFAAMLRYILEHNDPNDPERNYIDYTVFNEKYVEGLNEFIEAFKSWWDKVDPVTGHKYFTLEWAEARTGIPKEKIEWLAHTFGKTKPAALVWGMQAPGHHYNGYVASILGVVLNIITGNFDRKGGVIDTELVKSSKGGPATGKQFNKRKVKRAINGKEVEAEQEWLNYKYSDWPAAWDDILGDLPRLIMEGVEIHYGPFRGHKYPIKAYIVRASNPLVTAGPPHKWIEAFTAKEPDGSYKLELFVYLDTVFLETGLYADYVLPEASYLERMSVSDIYPVHPVIYLRDAVMEPLWDSKKPFDIVMMLARKVYEYEMKEFGRSDIRPEDFWEKYSSEEDFVNEMLSVAPGRPNVGRPLPYPNLPEGYKLVGTPESLEEGRVTIDHDKKTVYGEPVTVEYLRKHYGAAIWPMSWERYKVWDATKGDWVPGGILKTKTKKFELHFHRYEQYNKLVEESGRTPTPWRELGWDKLPTTFYWFETVWNPYTNPKYAKYRDEYPFQLIWARTHHGMTGTQLCEWTAQAPAEGLWMPLNRRFRMKQVRIRATGEPVVEDKEVKEGRWCVGTVQISTVDAEKLGIKTGDYVALINPLGRSVVAVAYVTPTIRPGVVRMGLGSGGRFSPGLGGCYFTRLYTPLTNELTDYKFSPVMGQPCYADMIVKIVKISEEDIPKYQPKYVLREYKVPGVEA